MLMGMSEEDKDSFLEKISATAMVNQAVLKCLVSGAAITHDNIILLIGDYADPTDPAHLSLIIQIQQIIDEVVTAMNFMKLTRPPVH